MNNINIIIPMLGLGQRFKNETQIPKPLIEVNGKTLIEHSIESLNIQGRYIFITRDYENKEYNDKLNSIFKKLCSDYIEIKSTKNTNGPTETCLLALKHIIKNEPLIITNCDQLMRWDSKKFLNEVMQKNADGALVLFKSNNEKHSFAKIKNNLIVETKEKKSISDNALVGIHYWKKAQFFIDSANLFLKNFKEKNILETYISETYNYLIQNNKKIIPFFINNEDYISLGTPQDIDIYKNKLDTKQ